jgi:hypothetical protein
VSAREKTMPDSNSSNGEVLTHVLKKMRSGEKIAPSECQEALYHRHALRVDHRRSLRVDENR